MKITDTLKVLMMLAACGGGSGNPPAAQDDGSAKPAAATAGTDATGPDTSGLADIVLGKINADPTRQEMKSTGKLLDFSIVSVNTESFGGDTASAVVECAGTVQFDADADWGMNGVKKAGEPAKFECQAEYVNEGDGWKVFGPMGIYPL